MAQDLQAVAAAAAAAVDVKAVADTVIGLTKAVKFWGGFIGDNVFDASYVKGKMSELEGKRDDLEKYASDDGTKALVLMNQSLWGITTSIKAI